MPWVYIAFKKNILGIRLCNQLFLDRYSIANHKSTIANPVAGAPGTLDQALHSRPFVGFP
jgi:hypothetical protein